MAMTTSYDCRDFADVEREMAVYERITATRCVPSESTFSCSTYQELRNNTTLRSASANEGGRSGESALRGSLFGSPGAILAATLRKKTLRPGSSCAPRDSNPKPAD